MSLAVPGTCLRDSFPLPRAGWSDSQRADGLGTDAAPSPPAAMPRLPRPPRASAHRITGTTGRLLHTVADTFNVPMVEHEQEAPGDSSRLLGGPLWTTTASSFRGALGRRAGFPLEPSPRLSGERRRWTRPRQVAHHGQAPAEASQRGR